MNFLRALGISLAVFHVVLFTSSLIPGIAPPNTDIHWPQSLAWFSLYLYPFYRAVKYRWRNALGALGACLTASVMGYFLHYPIEGIHTTYLGYDLYTSAILYMTVSYICAVLDQNKMAIMGVIKTVAGIVTALWVGRYLNTADHFWWRIADCVFFAAMLFPVMTKVPEDDPKTPTKDSAEEQQKYREAA